MGLDLATLDVNINTADVARGEGDLEGLTRAGTRAEAAMGMLSRRAKTTGTQLNKATMHTANLSAQFNDIGVMLAAGQNPFQLAIQQGTQINQVLNQMGGGVGALRALGAAFLQMINPMSLMTIGLITGGVALAQWAFGIGSAADKAKTFSDHMKDLSDQLKSVADAQKLARASVSDLIDEFNVANPLFRDTLRELAAIEQSKLASKFREIGTELNNLLLAMPGASDAEAITRMFNLKELTSAGRAAGREISYLGKELQQAGPLAEKLSIALDLKDRLSDATNEFTSMSKEQEALYQGLVSYIFELQLAGAEVKGHSTLYTALTTNAVNFYELAKKLAKEKADEDAKGAAVMLKTLQDELRIKELTMIHGKDSLEVRQAEQALAMSALQTELAGLSVTQATRDAILDTLEATQQIENQTAAWSKSMGDVQERVKNVLADTKTAQQTLAMLQQELLIKQLTLQYGRESVQVREAEQRAAAALLQEELAGLDVADSLKQTIMATLGEIHAADDATAAWASTMASVKGEVMSILSALSSLGGAVIANAAKSAQLTALQAGKSIAEARNAAEAFKAETEFDARSSSAGTIFEKMAIEAERFVWRQGEALETQITQEEEAIRERERLAKKAASGGGGGKDDPFFTADKLRALTESLRLEREVLDDWYQESQALLMDRRAQELLGEQEHKEALLALENQYATEIVQIKQREADHVRNAQRAMYSELGSLLSAFGSKSKAAAVAAIAINTALRATEASQNTAAAMMRAYAELGPIAGAAAAAKIGAFGKLQVAAIIAGGAVQAGSALGSPSSDSGGAFSQTTAAADIPTHHRVLIEGIEPTSLYTGEQVKQITDAVYEELGNKGRGDVTLVFT